MIQTPSLKKGFTLIEMLLVVGLLGIIFGVVVAFQVGVLKWNTYSENALETIADARIIVRTMVKELRSTSPANDGSYPILSAATSTMTFYSDTNGDGLKERIRYYLSGTALKRGSITPSGSPLTYASGSEIISNLLYNVRNVPTSPIFEYFDSTYDGTTAPLSQPVPVTQIRLVKINLSLDVNVNKEPPARLYTSQVMLRNIKDNL